MHKVTVVNLKPENDIKQTEIIESESRPDYIKEDLNIYGYTR